MCSKTEVRALGMACLMAWGMAGALLPVSAQVLDPALPSAAQVEAERERLKSDPNLPAQRMEKTLRFIDKKKPEDKKPHKPTAPWLIDAMRWFNETGRLLVWALGAVVVALLLVGLRTWIKVRGDRALPAGRRPPSHVRDLDIRPESLPDRIGPAALALWQAGEHRAALSLLYRGALSRLVHDHEVAITAASTEGDCLRLAGRQLDAERLAYVDGLVQAWLLAVYGHRVPEDVVVQALCAQFDARLGPVVPAPSGVSP
ncbi:MAG TPA: DUF4129 domain-containing protein [Aquabacterium sp.]|nr:DUF4129 domain-containing protein [Aquabacterium sp.]